MGIVRFYSWLRGKNYRGVLIRRVPQYVSSFSFDFNGIIHNVAQTVYAYGKGENPARKKLVAKADPKILEAEFYQALATKLSEVISAVQPQEILVLAVDGVAPQAKIAQQRQRRFRSAMESNTSIFNSSSITPGTEFMKRLDNFIQRWIISAAKTLPPKVIYSSHMVPGEAEHKIFQMMRNGEIEGNGAHVVYGMDADLIMLSLLSPLDQIFLMREDVRDVIDIDNLKTSLKEDIPSNTAVEDFVVMIYLIGNDFLPHLPALHDMNDAIDTLMEVYNRNKLSLTKNGEIDWENLSSYLTLLASEETRLLESEAKRDMKYPSRMLNLATQRKEISKDGKIVHITSFDSNIFRAAWYENAFQLKGINSKDVFSKLIPNFTFGPTNKKIVEMVKQYLTGISWVHRYYNVGKDSVNNDYVYRYSYSPLLSDIAAVSKQYKVLKEDYEFNPNAVEINPVHQLLSVLPLKSKNLLPVEVQHLANPDSMIGDYFSEKQILERDGFNTDWEGILLLNFVDMKRIIDAVEKTSVFSPERIREFSPTYNIVLKKDPEALAISEKNRKLKKYLESERRGRGRGRGKGYSKPRGRGRGRGRGGRKYSEKPRQDMPPLPKLSTETRKALPVQKFEL